MGQGLWCKTALLTDDTQAKGIDLGFISSQLLLNVPFQRVIWEHLEFILVKGRNTPRYPAGDASMICCSLTLSVDPNACQEKIY